MHYYRPTDDDIIAHIIIIGLLALAIGALCGCEPESALNLANEKPDKEEQALLDGAVKIELGDDATVEKVDTIGDSVEITAGDNATIGPINTAPMAQD